LTAINDSSITNPPPLAWHKRHARQWMGFSMLLSDLLALGISAFAVLLLRRIWEAGWHQPSIEMFILIGMANTVLFGLRGLYPGIGLSPVAEIRSISITISTATLGLAALTFFIPSLSSFPRLSLGLFWLFCLFNLPVMRLAVRYTLSRSPAWGEPVILLGGGKRAQFIYEHLHKRRMLGFDPVILSPQGETVPLDIHSPHLELEKLLEQPESLRRLGIRTALITAGSIPEPTRSRLLRLQGNTFERLIKVPGEHNLGSLGVSALDLDGVFAYEVRQNLACKSRRAIKRLLDLTLTLLGGLLLVGLLLLIAALVKRSSPGPVFYKQTRIGKGGQRFQAWKFRTMVADAENCSTQPSRQIPNCWPNGKPPKNSKATRASPPSGASCANSASTNCPNSSTSCAAK
jgi:hypothetical protein